MLQNILRVSTLIAAQEFDLIPQIIYPRERELGQDTFLQFIAPFSLLVYSKYTHSHTCMGLGIYCVFEEGSNLHTWQPLLSCDIGKQIQIYSHNLYNL